MTVRVALPQHLQTLARVAPEVQVEVEAPVTTQRILDALEGRYPVLRGTIREHGTRKRRAYLRFFACSEDVSHAPVDVALPAGVATGAEPFIVLGALSGG